MDEPTALMLRLVRSTLAVLKEGSLKEDFNLIFGHSQSLVSIRCHAKRRPGLRDSETT